MNSTLRPRATRHTAATIDGALVRVRILIGLAALVLATHSLVGEPGARSILAVGAAATALAFVPAERLLRRVYGVVRTSVVVTTVDILMVIATLGLLDVHPGDPVSLLLLLPLVQAGVRHGTLGAFITWFAAAAAVVIQTTAEWNGTPGQVSGPLIFVVILLFTALPAAGLGDRLAERMHALSQAASRADTRAEALADVLDANLAIAGTTPERRIEEIVRQAERLVHGDADVVAFDPAIDTAPSASDVDGSDPHSLLHDVDGRQMIRIPLGGTPPMVLTASTHGIDDIYAIEALDLLAVTARTIASSEQPSPEAAGTDDDPTIGIERRSTAATTPLSDRITTVDPDVFDRPGIDRFLDARLADGLVTRLAVVSLDNLKLTNDLDGRDAGNVLISQVGTRLAAISSTVAIAWLGGDEFIVVGGVGDPSNSFSAEIRRALQGRVDIGTATPTAIHSSVGVALAATGETAAQLVRRARETMFADKRQQNRDFLDQVELELASRVAGLA